MSWNRDLSPRWIYVKAVLFAIILVLSGLMIVVEERLWMRALLLPLVIWGAARLYYFMFYVIQHYVDPGYKFAGLWHCLRYLSRRRRRRV